MALGTEAPTLLQRKSVPGAELWSSSVLQSAFPWAEAREQPSTRGASLLYGSE